MYYENNERSKANSAVDLESIRLLGRTLLADNKDILLSKDRNDSKNLMIWLEEKMKMVMM